MESKNKYPKYYPLLEIDDDIYESLFVTYDIENITNSKYKFYLREDIPHLYRLYSVNDVAYDTTKLCIKCPICNKDLKIFSKGKDSKMHDALKCIHCKYEEV